MDRLNGEFGKLGNPRDRGILQRTLAAGEAIESAEANISTLRNTDIKPDKLKSCAPRELPTAF